MPDDLRGSGPKNVWLNQPTESPTMTIKLIHQKSRDLRARTRRKLAGSVVAPLGVGIFCAFSMKAFGPLPGVLQPIFAVSFIWSVAGLYFLNRGMWSVTTPADMGFSTGLDFCRREINRQRDLVRRMLLWSFGPLMLAIGAFIAALVMISTAERAIFPNGLPFLILLVIWIATYFIIRLQEQRKLQREFDELNDIEKENQSL